MVLDLLIEKIKYYYPVGISSMNEYDKYILTPEYERLDSQKAILYSSPISPKFSAILIFLNGHKDFCTFDDHSMPGFDRCFTFQGHLSQHFGFNGELVIQISVLLPVYTLRVRRCGKVVDNLKLDVSVKNYVDFIESELNSRYNLTRLGEEILRYKLPNISFQDIDFGEFSVYNALFSDQ